MELRELAPGEYEATDRGWTCRVVVPAGVGVPGVAEDELVRLLVTILLERGVTPPAVLDVSLVLGTDPELFDEVSRRAEG